MFRWKKLTRPAAQTKTSSATISVCCLRAKATMRSIDGFPASQFVLFLVALGGAVDEDDVARRYLIVSCQTIDHFDHAVGDPPGPDRARGQYPRLVRAD